MIPERILFAVIVFGAVAAFIFAIAGRVDIVAGIATVVFLAFCTMVLLWTRGVGREEES